MQLFQAINSRQTLLTGFAESNTGIQDNPVIGNSRLLCQMNALSHIIRYFSHKIFVNRFFSVVYQAAGNTSLCNHPCHLRIKFQSPYIVDHICTCRNACPGGLAVVGVQRYGYIKSGFNFFDYRNHPFHFFLCFQGIIRTGFCGFAAHVNQIRTCRNHFFHMTQCLIRIIELPAIRERIRGHI